MDTSVNTHMRPFVFCPHARHATMPFNGERWCITAYTASGSGSLPPDFAGDVGRFPVSLAQSSLDPQNRMREETVEPPVSSPALCSARKVVRHSKKGVLLSSGRHYPRGWKYESPVAVTVELEHCPWWMPGGALQVLCGNQAGGLLWHVMCGRRKRLR